MKFTVLIEVRIQKALERISGKSVLHYGLKLNESFNLSKPHYELGKFNFTVTSEHGCYDFEFPWMGFSI